MELGEKIKAARLEAGLSQRQLCGEAITRNMLSLIESGRAKPSMDTLRYLSRRLGKSMGYFLEEQAVSVNQVAMQTAGAAYKAGAYRQALETLEGYRGPDEVFDRERYLLGALAAMALTEQALEEGKNAYAVSLLDKARSWGEKSVYWTEDLERRRLLLLFAADTDRAGELAASLPSNLSELLLRAKAALAVGAPERCISLLDAAPEQNDRWYFFRGQALMALEKYPLAAESLRRAEEAFPRACLPLLETCYREMGDYKRAYEYACKQK